MSEKIIRPVHDERLKKSIEASAIVKKVVLFVKLISKKYNKACGYYGTPSKIKGNMPQVRIFLDKEEKKMYTLLEVENVVLRIYNSTSWSDVKRILDKNINEEKVCDVCFEKQDNDYQFCFVCGFRCCFECIYEMKKLNHSQFKCPGCRYAYDEKIYNQRERDKAIMEWKSHCHTTYGYTFKEDVKETQ